MLTPIPNTNPVQKQITLDFADTNNLILYTVPEGKTCTGTFIGAPGSTGTANINGKVFNMTNNGVAASATLSVVLIAGTVLRAKGSDGQCRFVGVEQ